MRLLESEKSKRRDRHHIMLSKGGRIDRPHYSIGTVVKMRGGHGLENFSGLSGYKGIIKNVVKSGKNKGFAVVKFVQDENGNKISKTEEVPMRGLFTLGIAKFMPDIKEVIDQVLKQRT